MVEAIHLSFLGHGLKNQTWASASVGGSITTLNAGTELRDIGPAAHPCS